MPMTPAHAAYLRHPDVRGDLVTFTAANDVWLAPLAGGRAWRLTDEGAPVGYPRFSPDGAHIAFTSRTSGGPEVWVIPTEGDTAPRRLTAWGRPSTKVAGWLPDGRILATSSYGAPIARDAQLWAIDLDGTAELLPLGRSGEVAIHPSGTTVVATPWRRDQASWKHYQGGTAVKLWISREDVPLDGSAEDHAARSWEPLLDEVLASKLRIAWYGDRLLFASDTPGPGAALAHRARAHVRAGRPPAAPARAGAAALGAGRRPRAAPGLAVRAPAGDAPAARRARERRRVAGQRPRPHPPRRPVAPARRGLRSAAAGGAS